MLKIALVFLHESSEYSNGDFRVYHSSIYANDHNTGVVEFIFEDLFGREDNIITKFCCNLKFKSHYLKKYQSDLVPSSCMSYNIGLW